MLMEGVILAAGVGSRLGKIAHGAKFAVKVAGRPLIHYPILSLASIGLRKVVIVTRGQLIPLLQRVLHGLKDFVEYEICINNDWRRENGFSLYISRECVEGDVFLLSMSDHVYPSDLPARIIREFSMHPDSIAIIGGDRKPRYIDVEEATMIKARDRTVERVGKNLDTWDYIDTGVFVFRREIFAVADYVASRRYSFGISDVLNTAIEKGYRVRVADVTGLPWTEIDTVEDYLRVIRGSRREVVHAAVESWSPHNIRYG